MWLVTLLWACSPSPAEDPVEDCERLLLARLPLVPDPSYAADSEIVGCIDLLLAEDPLSGLTFLFPALARTPPRRERVRELALSDDFFIAWRAVSKAGSFRDMDILVETAMLRTPDLRLGELCVEPRTGLASVGCDARDLLDVFRWNGATGVAGALGECSP